MKKLITLIFISFLCVTVPMSVTANAAKLMSDADAMFDSKNGSLDDYKKSAELYKQVLQTEPDNFEATWKCARSLRYYGDKAKMDSIENWEDICATYGQEAMGYAQKAIELKPDQPDGYFFYGLSVGVYSDGVSILTALKEGLKDKTQSSFEKVLELDRMYEKGGALIGIGRFWSVLPWPLHKKEKALEYLREYQKTEFFGQEPTGVVYLAELLIDLGGDKNEAEAKTILDTFNPDKPYYKKIKADLLKQL